MKLKFISKSASFWASGRAKELRSMLDTSVTIPESKRNRFFKIGVGEYAHGDQFLGVTNPSLRRIASTFKDLQRGEVLQLISSVYNEERFLALVIMVQQYRKGDDSTKDDVYSLYMSNLAYVNNWNLVDASAIDIVGAHLYSKCGGRSNRSDETESVCQSTLETLATSNVMWHRRIAIVSTCFFIRKGELDWTFKIARVLLSDSEDLIHKAVGWMLREAGKKNSEKLTIFLNEHAAKMPRTMLRYSIEKYDPVDRAAFLSLPTTSTTTSTTLLSEV